MDFTSCSLNQGDGGGGCFHQCGSMCKDQDKPPTDLAADSATHPRAAPPPLPSIRPVPGHHPVQQTTYGGISCGGHHCQPSYAMPWADSLEMSRYPFLANHHTELQQQYPVHFHAAPPPYCTCLQPMPMMPPALRAPPLYAMSPTNVTAETCTCNPAVSPESNHQQQRPQELFQQMHPAIGKQTSSRRDAESLVSETLTKTPTLTVEDKAERLAGDPETCSTMLINTSEKTMPKQRKNVGATTVHRDREVEIMNKPRITLHNPDDGVPSSSTGDCFPLNGQYTSDVMLLMGLFCLAYMFMTFGK